MLSWVENITMFSSILTKRSEVQYLNQVYFHCASKAHAHSPCFLLKQERQTCHSTSHTVILDWDLCETPGINVHHSILDSNCQVMLLHLHLRFNIIIIISPMHRLYSCNTLAQYSRYILKLRKWTVKERKMWLFNFLYP